MKTNQLSKYSLKNILDRHVELGVESIFSAVYSGSDISTLSFYHLVNRIMMVVQMPLTFVIYLEINGIKQIHHRTNHHRRHEKKIDKALEHPSISANKHHFPVWHYQDGEQHRYTLIALKADSSYEFTALEIINEIDCVKTPWDAASYKLWKVLQSSSYERYGDSFFKILPKTLKSIGASIVDSICIPDISMDTNVKTDFYTGLLENSTRYELEEQGVLDKVFKKISRSISQVNYSNPVSTNGKKSITNFILFSRDYVGCTQGNWRHDKSYDYSLRILLCSTQRKELKEYLEWMKVNKTVCEKDFLTEIQLAKITVGQNLILEANKKFWNYLEANQFEKVLNVFSDDFSKDARSMADPVFDGVSFYRQPFAHDGGLGRVFDVKNLPGSLDELQDQDERINDLVRVVICQYLFQGFAEKASGDDPLQLQIMLNPIEIGGKVWGVVGFSTRSHRIDFKFDLTIEECPSIKNYDMVWSKNYHIYRDVNEKFKKNLRTYMNRYYENFIAQCFTRWISQAETQARNEKVLVKTALKQLNANLLSLARIFPYNAVTCELSNFDKKERFPRPSSRVGTKDRDTGRLSGERRVLLAEKMSLLISVTHSSMFPPAHGVSPAATRRFVDPVDVAVAMTDASVRHVVAIAQ